jgi:hypothetical protein
MAFHFPKLYPVVKLCAVSNRPVKFAKLHIICLFHDNISLHLEKYVSIAYRNISQGSNERNSVANLIFIFCRYAAALFAVIL